MSTSRRVPLKWHPPPPPTPRIIHFPRRHRRKPPSKTSTTAANPPSLLRRPHTTKKLEALFDEERGFSNPDLPIVLLRSGRRERVVEEEDEVRRVDCELLEREKGVEERERERVVEVEMLRAECRFLRMEREVAMKKLEQNKVQMEKTLRSAVNNLISCKNKIGEQRSEGLTLKDEIEDLAEKLMMLQKNSSGDKEIEVCSCSNFDKQVSILQRRLHKLGSISDDKHVKEIRKMAESSFSCNSSSRFDDQNGISNRKSSKFTDIEVLEMKMEGLSKGMLLERMEEEYNSSVMTSVSNSKRSEFQDHKEKISRGEMENLCSGRCKAIVKRIIEQVKVESEQWAQMQAMLEQVKGEMEEMQASRDFWEDQAVDSGLQIQSLHSSVQEWEEKAHTFETKANELQAQISVLKSELNTTKNNQNKLAYRTKKVRPQISLDEQIEKEKRVLICRLKENRHTSASSNNGTSKQQNVVIGDNRGKLRPPLRDMGNSSPYLRQIISKEMFKSYCPQGSNEL